MGAAHYDLTIPVIHPAHELAALLTEKSPRGVKPPREYVGLLGKLSMAYLLSESEDKLWHEWHHFLQMLAYPFQYLQACRELSGLVTLIETIAADRGAAFSLSAPPIPPAWRDTLRAPAQFYRVIERDGLPTMDDRRVPPAERGARDISETDLLEEATSVFVYRTLGGKEDGNAYAAWVTKTAGYSVVFRLLARRLGKTEAYLALTPLVQASFFSTDPCAVFLGLLGVVIRDSWSVTRLGVTEFYTRCWQVISLLPEIEPDFTVPRESLTRDKVYRIRWEGFGRLIRKSYFHPAFPIVVKYMARLAAEPTTRFELLSPMPQKVRQGLWQEFRPLAINILVRPEGVAANSVVTIPSTPALDSAIPPEHPYHQFRRNSKPLNYAQLYLYLRPVKDMALAMLPGAGHTEHRCPHTSCPVHRTRVCRQWNPLPADYRACPFPGWLTFQTEHVLDPVARSLLPVSGHGRASRAGRRLAESWPDGWRRYAGRDQGDWIAMTTAPLDDAPYNMDITEADSSYIRRLAQGG